jgi:hypothetical protein
MKQAMQAMLLTLASLMGLGVSAVGLEQREVVVTVPYDFVAGGTTLPAGTYAVSRVSDNRLGGLNLNSYETNSSAFVLPNQFDGHPLDNTKVTFEQVGDMHFLRSIETRDGVYTFALPRVMNLVARTKQQHDTMSSSGTN